MTVSASWWQVEWHFFLTVWNFRVSLVRNFYYKFWQFTCKDDSFEKWNDRYWHFTSGIWKCDLKNYGFNVKMAVWSCLVNFQIWLFIGSNQNSNGLKNVYLSNVSNTFQWIRIKVIDSFTRKVNKYQSSSTFRWWILWKALIKVLVE